MGLYEEGVTVVLTKDLTRYHPALVPGASGTTTPPVGRYSAVSDRYVAVAFEGVEEPIDVLWSHLKMTDERVKAIESKAHKKWVRGLQKNVDKATLTLGIKGGFRKLMIRYKTGRREKIYTKKRADQAIAIMLEAGVVVHKERP